MGTPAQVLPLAEQYLRVVFLSMPFLYVFAFLVMVQRGAGDARTPFWFMTLATLLDLTLNPMLIAGIGPFPRLGIAGAATSLLVSQATAMTAMVIFLYWRKAELRITRDELHYLIPDRALLWTSIIKGLASPPQRPTRSPRKSGSTCRCQQWRSAPAYRRWPRRMSAPRNGIVSSRARARAC
jgi:Na+-driven multidrug efflux pump